MKIISILLGVFFLISPAYADHTRSCTLTPHYNGWEQLDYGVMNFVFSGDSDLFLKEIDMKVHVDPAVKLINDWSIISGESTFTLSDARHLLQAVLIIPDSSKMNGILVVTGDFKAVFPTYFRENKSFVFTFECQ